MNETEWKLRVDLAAAFHMAVEDGLHEGIANHFSAVLEGSDQFLVNPFGLHFSEITASNLIVCDFNGDVLRGEGAPAPSAVNIHAPIHRLVANAGVLMHTHQPYATALTMIANGRLEWALQTSCRFYGRVVYDTDYDGVALSESVGERMAKMLGDADLMFLGNHGILTAAPTVAQAYDDLYFIERAAQAQILAMSTGKPLVQLDQQTVELVASQTRYERLELGYIERHFQARKRLLDASHCCYQQ